MYPHKLHNITKVPISKYKVLAKNLIHINRAIIAIKKNNVGMLQTILSLDPSVHSIKNNRNHSVLFFALKYRKRECLSAIINDAGFDNAFINQSTCTILSWIRTYFNNNTFQSWKESKFYRRNHLQMFLKYAVCISNNNKSLIRRLVQEGADLNFKEDSHDYSALEYVKKFKPQYLCVLT